jgi:GNAT superfamily N-acetyltransferase
VRSVPLDGFELDDDPTRVDVAAVHRYISEESYWGRGRSRELMERAISGSRRVVGLYSGDEQVGFEQIGFARAVSDGVTFAYLADVYVLRSYRGRGLGLALVREMVDSEEMREVHWLLHTADAQALYAKLHFQTGPMRYTQMERRRGYDSRP